MRNVVLVGLITALAIPCASAQTVHVLNGGGRGALQAVVDAAGDGDTILVHGGAYGPTTVAAKALTILCEPELGASVDRLTITSTSAAQRCIVAGFDLISNGSDAPLRVLACNGSVRLEAVRCMGGPSTDGATVDSSSDVAFVRSTLLGGNQIPTPGPDVVIFPIGRGLFASASHVALYDATCSGGDGQDAHFINSVFWSVSAGPGGAGVEADGSATVFVARSTVQGGDGGEGRDMACGHLPCGFTPTDGANGGAGVLAAAGSTAVVFDSTSTGGAGGSGGTGGQCCPQTTWLPGADGAAGPATGGAATTLPGTSASLSVQHVVRESSPLLLFVTGTPGDRVILAFSFDTRWAFDPGLSGVRLFGPQSRRIPLGTIPGSGMLTTSLPVPALPPGVGAQNWYLQIVVQTGTGPFRLGSPAWLTILDSIY